MPSNDAVSILQEKKKKKRGEKVGIILITSGEELASSHTLSRETPARDYELVVIIAFT